MKLRSTTLTVIKPLFLAGFDHVIFNLLGHDAGEGYLGTVVLLIILFSRIEEVSSILQECIGKLGAGNLST